MNIGAKIRRYRLKNSLTLEELASRTELSKGFLSQCENDLTSPSIATLADITEALGVTLEQFFAKDKHEQIVFKTSDFFIDEQDEYTIHWIVPNAQKNQMEPIMIEIKPQGLSQEIIPHSGEEFGYVLKGKIKLEMEGQNSMIRKGETFYLGGNKPHRLVNPSTSNTAVVLWICTPPIF